MANAAARNGWSSPVNRTGASPTRRRVRIGGGRRRIGVGEPLGVGASVAFELCLDPRDGVTIAFRALPAIAELRQSFDRALVSLEIEAIDEGLYRVVRRIGRRSALRRRDRRNSRRHEETVASCRHETIESHQNTPSEPVVRHREGEHALIAARTRAINLHPLDRPYGGNLNAASRRPPMMRGGRAAGKEDR